MKFTITATCAPHQSLADANWLGNKCQSSWNHRHQTLAKTNFTGKMRHQHRTCARFISFSCSSHIRSSKRAWGKLESFAARATSLSYKVVTAHCTLP